MATEKAQNRAARIKKAIELITANPHWGKDKINAELKKEFGVGLRRQDIAKLKEISLTAKPTSGRRRLERLMELDIPPRVPREKLIAAGIEEHYHRMRAHGFLDFEIRHIMSAGNLPVLFTSKPFREMLQNRLAWIIRMRKKYGWTREQIIQAIKEYYSKPRHSPFDFLRREYKPPLKIDTKTYRELARVRAEAVTAELYSRTKPRI